MSGARESEGSREWAEEVVEKERRVREFCERGRGASERGMSELGKRGR